MSKTISNSVYRKAVSQFYRVFYPFKTEQDVDNTVESGIALDQLYATLIKERYIPLSQQQGVSFPTQRSKEWFKERSAIESTVTGSKPSGWYFGIKNKETYVEEMAYLHGLKKKVFSKEALARMNYGTKFESHAEKCFIDYYTSKLNVNMYLYETGFKRNTTIPHVGASPDGLIASYFPGFVLAHKDSVTKNGEQDYLVAFMNEFKEIDTYVIHGEERLRCAKENMEKLKAQWDTLLYWKDCKIELKKSWTKVTEFLPVYGARMSVLELKCPASKLPSQVPYYYMCQLHSEMASFNLKETVFVCWIHDKNKGTEKLRCWKVKFHKQFWEDFLQIVDLVRMKNSDGSRGAPWCQFGNHWFKFKAKYSRKAAWIQHVIPYFLSRDYCLNRPFTMPDSNK